MANGQRNDPYRSFNFRVDIDGLSATAFSEVSGLTAEGDSVDYREGTDATNTVRKLIGLRKYGTLTLKRGYTTSNELWTWYRNILNGVPDRRDGSITLMNEAHEDVMTWSFVQAWLNKVEGPSFNASGNEVAIESMELIHEGLSLEE